MNFSDRNAWSTFRGITDTNTSNTIQSDARFRCCRVFWQWQNMFNRLSVWKIFNVQFVSLTAATYVISYHRWHQCCTVLTIVLTDVESITCATGRGHLIPAPLSPESAKLVTRSLHGRPIRGRGWHDETCASSLAAAALGCCHRPCRRLSHRESVSSAALYGNQRQRWFWPSNAEPHRAIADACDASKSARRVDYIVEGEHGHHRGSAAAASTPWAPYTDYEGKARLHRLELRQREVLTEFNTCMTPASHALTQCSSLSRNKQSLDLTITRMFVKICHSGSYAVVKECQVNFGFYL